MSLRIRRGTDTQRSSIVFDPGELAWCLDTRKLYVGDGLTPGGVNVLAYMAGVGVSFNSGTQALDFSQGNLTLTTADIAEDPSRLYYTDVRAKDAVGAMFQAGSNTGITFSYDSSSQAITVNSTGHQLPTASLPGDAGKYLTLDNSGNPVWHNPPIQGGLSLPSFGGAEIGKYLTTDGTYLVWADIAINSLVNGAFHVDLDSAGNLTTSGTIKLPSTADIVRETGVSTGIYTSVLGGLGSVSADTSPSLGGNLSAGGYNISSVGTLSATTVSATTVSAPTITSTGSITASSGGTIGTSKMSIDDSTNKITNLSLYNGFIIDPANADTETLTFYPNAHGLATINVRGFSSDTYTSTTFMNFSSSRGTIDAPLIHQNGDNLGGIGFRTKFIQNPTPPFDGWSPVAGIAGVVDDVGDGVSIFPKGRLRLIVAGNFASPTDPSTAVFADLEPSGAFTAPILKPGVYADTTARDSYIFAPEAGMMIFLTSTKKFQGYDGTSWVDLN